MQQGHRAQGRARIPSAEWFSSSCGHFHISANLQHLSGDNNQPHWGVHEHKQSHGQITIPTALLMIISTTLLLQLTPQEQPLHSMLSPFYSDCKTSHWAEPGLGRSLSGCFWGCWYPATDGVPLLWSAEAICIPRLPREMSRSVSNGVDDLINKETG